MRNEYIKPEVEIINISVEEAIMVTSPNSVEISDEEHDGGPAGAKKRNSFWD